jgi:hypothetical protein
MLGKLSYCFVTAQDPLDLVPALLCKNPLSVKEIRKACSIVMLARVKVSIGAVTGVENFPIRLLIMRKGIE